MARLRCVKCYYEWERRIKMSRGQLIRCPRCRMTLGKLSKPIKPMTTREYIEKGIDEFGDRKRNTTEM